MIPEDSIKLWSVVFGSHLWEMQTPTSDHDIATIYQVPTKTILSGRPFDQTRPQIKYNKDGIKCEETFWEIGHLIRYLLKGNCNAIWMTMSPKRLTSFEYHDELCTIIKNNLAKNIYDSVHGMALSQMSDATKRNLGMKGYRTAWRTMNFGINILDDHGILFESAPDQVSESECNHMIICLQDAFEGSNLPDTPNAEQFYEYLYKIRKLNLEEC